MQKDFFYILLKHHFVVFFVPTSLFPSSFTPSSSFDPIPPIRLSLFFPFSLACVLVQRNAIWCRGGKEGSGAYRLGEAKERDQSRDWET